MKKIINFLDREYEHGQILTYDYDNVSYEDIMSNVPMLMGKCAEIDFALIPLEGYDGYMFIDMPRLIKEQALFAKVPQYLFGEFIGRDGGNLAAIKENIATALEKANLSMPPKFKMVMIPAFGLDIADDIFRVVVTCNEDIEAANIVKLVDDITWQEKGTHWRKSKTILTLYYVGEENAVLARDRISPTNKVSIYKYD